MIDPLRLTFTVACDAEHAFSTWTGRVSLWWPVDHTVSQRSGVKVLIEPVVGGRIFEKAPSGQEFDWGWVTIWDPPGRLAYKWHLGAEPRHATDVEVTFAQRPDGTTQVDIEHRGWDAFGPDAEPRRRGNQAGWSEVLPLFAAACQTGRPVVPAPAPGLAPAPGP
ncbi:MAG: SRPBCC domain-containing protein [Actinomycetota bacterium]|nr:SRPBCC domain-containing protein [Actinomycetota bacterium]